MVTRHNQSEYAFSGMCGWIGSQGEAIEALRTSALHFHYAESRVTREIMRGKIARIEIWHAQSITIKD